VLRPGAGALLLVVPTGPLRQFPHGHPLQPVGAGKYPGKGHATAGQGSLAGQVPKQVQGKWHLPALTGGRDLQLGGVSMYAPPPKHTGPVVLTAISRLRRPTR